MAWRFNAPPGWPVPPDFVPPQGWVPDPAWPPAPADWTYWVEAPAQGPWGDPYGAASPAYGAAPGYGVPTGYQGAPGYGAPAPQRGLPGWVIGLIAAGVAFAVLSVIGVLFVGGLALYAVTNGSAKGFLADVAAGDACNQATTALDVPAAGPDPVRAEVQARELESALEAADAAVGFDDTYEPLRDDIDAAQTAAQRIAELPQDPSTWTPVQRDRAVQEQAELEAISTRITNACSTIDVPFEDEFNGPTV